MSLWTWRVRLRSGTERSVVRLDAPPRACPAEVANAARLVAMGDLARYAVTLGWDVVALVAPEVW